MTTSRVNHLVNELETTLGLLKSLMRELKTTERESASGQRIHELIHALSGRRDLDGLPSLLLNAYTEVTAALGGVRVSREAIQSQAIDQLRATNEKLAQVSSHTEAAATKMLDGLDRTLVLSTSCPIPSRTTIIHCKRRQKHCGAKSTSCSSVFSFKTSPHNNSKVP